jgi:sugar O-acyltransferase (sialic acid O-acetyltransferase NeuD family)
VNGRPTIVLAGAGGHARACIDVLEQEGRFAIAGLLGTADEVGTVVLGYRVLGTDRDLRPLLREHAHALVTVGQIKTPELRMRLFDSLADAGATFPVVVSPRAYVSPHATLGPGTIVMHGAVVNAAATVGRNCIINSQALVEHDAAVGDHCHIATGANINSAVRVGAGTFIGSGAAVRQCVTIGERCVIGMGRSVLRDCAPRTQVPEARVRS